MSETSLFIQRVHQFGQEFRELAAKRPIFKTLDGRWGTMLRDWDGKCAGIHFRQLALLLIDSDRKLQANGHDHAQDVWPCTMRLLAWLFRDICQLSRTRAFLDENPAEFQSQLARHIRQRFQCMLLSRMLYNRLIWACRYNGFPSVPPAQPILLPNGVPPSDAVSWQRVQNASVCFQGIVEHLPGPYTCLHLRVTRPFLNRIRGYQVALREARLALEESGASHALACLRLFHIGGEIELIERITNVYSSFSFAAPETPKSLYHWCVAWMSGFPAIHRTWSGCVGNLLFPLCAYTDWPAPGLAEQLALTTWQLTCAYGNTHFRIAEEIGRHTQSLYLVRLATDVIDGWFAELRVQHDLLEWYFTRPLDDPNCT